MSKEAIIIRSASAQERSGDILSFGRLVHLASDPAVTGQLRGQGYRIKQLDERRLQVQPPMTAEHITELGGTLARLAWWDTEVGVTTSFLDFRSTDDAGRWNAHQDPETNNELPANLITSW